MIDVLAELAKILRETRTGKVADKLIEDLKVSLEVERKRQREQQNQRQAACRASKREQRSASLPVTVTVGSVLLPVTVTPPPPSPDVTVTSEPEHFSRSNTCLETMPCKEKNFPPLSSRFSSCVTQRDGVTERDDLNLSDSSIPCQATLFPLAGIQEERKKERTKERKKEETDRVLVIERKKESKNLYARAREAMPSLGGTPCEAAQQKTVRRNKVPIPDDWQLSAAGLEFAKREGLSPAAARLEAFRFADSARANGRTYADWNAAWRNWIRSPYRVRPAGAPSGEPFDVRRHIV